MDIDSTWQFMHDLARALERDAVRLQSAIKLRDIEAVRQPWQNANDSLTNVANCIRAFDS
jgi:uncharacterized phage-associated protein